MPSRSLQTPGSFPPILLAQILLVSACPAAEASLTTRDSALIQEAYHVWATQADKVWPGASAIRTPMLYVGETHEFAIEFDHPLRGFPGSGIATGKLGPVQIRSRTFAANISACLDIEGVTAVVMGRPEALEKSPEAWVLTASHELFHGYQYARGGAGKIDALGIGPKENAAWQLTFPFPYKDADVMRLIHLQGYLLWLASAASNADDAKYNVGTALDAALVYRARLDNLTQDAKAQRYSLFQEWSEGVAAYTEFKIGQILGTTDFQPTASFSALADFRGYASAWTADYQNRPFLVKHAGRATKSRTTFYHLGMGKALALDAVLPDWKTKYFIPGVWLDDLLREAIESR